MKQNFGICFFLLTLSQSYGWEEDDPYNVNKFNASYTKLNVDMGDVLDYMDIVAESTGIYLGPAGTVLPLLVKSTRVIFKPDSDETKAIKKLHQLLNVTQYRVLKAIETAQASTAAQQQSRDYSDKVAMPLGLFDDKMQLLWKNNFDLVETFGYVCNPLNVYTPRNALSFFQKRFLTNCYSLTSPEVLNRTAHNYGLALQFFQHFEKQFELSKVFMDKHIYERVKSDTLSAVAKMNVKEASSYLVSLYKVLKTRDFIKHDHLHRTRVFENMLPEDLGDGCYMYDTIIGYSYAHAPILAELKRITYDLVDISFACSFCSSFLNDGNPNLIEVELEQIKQQTSQILNFIKNFTLTQLESAWNGKLFQAKISSTLDDYDFQKNYGPATIKAENELNLLGSPIWTYQIMIYKSESYGSAIRCKNLFLCFQMDLNQFVSVYAFRFPKGSQDRAQSAGTWLTDDLKKQLCKAIKEKVGEDPPTIITAIEEYLQETVTNRYHGFSLIQERATDPDQIAINAEISPDRGGGDRNIKFQSRFECQKQYFWHLYKIQCNFYL